MSKYVLKFGGASLKDADAVKRASGIIKDFYEKNKPEQLVVVVSAPGKIGESDLEDKITNILEEIHKGDRLRTNFDEVKERTFQLCIGLGVPQPVHLYDCLEGAIKSSEKDDKGYSSIVSIGERISVHALGNFLKKTNPKTETFDFNEFGMITDSYREAFATDDATIEIEKSLNGKKGILVIPGFVGYNEKGEVTTLGRNSSNYSATKIAEAIVADGVYIFSDEPGVRRANPKLVPDAEIIKELTHMEAREYAAIGAKIINAKSIEPARRENIPIYIVDENYEGTKISRNINFEHMGAKIIASVPHHHVLTIEYGAREADKPGSLHEITGYFTEAKINIKSSPDETFRQSFAFLLDDDGDLDMLLRKIGKKYEYKLSNQFARVSLIGEGMAMQVGIVERFGRAYRQKGISFQKISQAEPQLNLTTYVKQEDERRAVRAVYDEFFRNNSKK